MWSLISLLAGFYGAAQAQVLPPSPCHVSEAVQRIELQPCQVETRDARGRRQLQAALLSDVTRTLHLDLGVPDAESVELELRQGGYLRTRLTLDGAAPYPARPVASPRLQFELQLPSGPSELVLRYRLHADGRVIARLWQAEALRDQEQLEAVLNGAIIGVMLTLFVVVLAYRLVVGAVAYQVYAVLVASELMLLVQTAGYGFAYFWPEYPGWNQHAPALFAGLALISHAGFALSFLQLRSHGLLYRLHLALMLAVLVAALLALYATLVLLGLVYAVLALWAGAHSVRKGLAGARLYLLGTVALIVLALCLFGLGVLGVQLVPGVSFFVYPKLGLLIEAAFFAAAMINRVRQHQEQLAEQRTRRLAEAEELLQAESQRRAALELAQRQQLQLASASHDISQPLASLRFAIEALKASASHDAIATHLDRTLDYAQTLLRDLMEQARRERPRPDTVDIGQLIAQVEQQQQGLAQQRRLRLRVRASRTVVAASELLLARILNNLVVNALRYTREGQVLVGVRRRADGIELQVLDTGPGLSPELQATLGRPFVRGEQLREDQPGHGLGLFIVKSLCAECGFELRVRSQPGRGSCFAVFIPH